MGPHFCQTRLTEMKGISSLRSLLASCLLVPINRTCHSLCLGYPRHLFFPASLTMTAKSVFQYLDTVSERGSKELLNNGITYVLYFQL